MFGFCSEQEFDKESTMLFNPADPYNEVAPHHPGAVGGPLSLVPPGGPPPPPFPLTPPSFLAPPQGAPGLATSSATTAAPSPPSPTPPLCAGCRLRIVDKFYLCAVESKWHTSCLKCAECGVELENQTSCFERDGQMYCKDDYVRIFTSKCFRCLNKLSSQDLVMKVRQCLFHVDCFRCATCDSSLKKGDLFGLVDDVPYCRTHYEHIMGPGPVTTVPPPPGSFSSDTISHHSPTDRQDEFIHRGNPVGADFGHPHPPPPPGMYPQGFDPLQGGPPPPGWFGFGPPGGPEGGPGGEGFPPYDNNNEPRLKKPRGRKKRKVETTAFAAINGYLANAAADGAFPVDGPNGSKTKRARTSFKHHQLRIMKAHFQINQNPDSRELKMLSQKTQLDKKVLQVWFQNARAKWRRTKAQDGGSGGGNVSASGSMLPGGPTTIPPAPTSSRGSEDGLDGLGGGPVSPCSDDNMSVSTDMMTCC